MAEGESESGTPESDALLNAASSKPQRIQGRDPDLTRQRKKDDLKLRKIVARGALSVMALQIAIADYIFYLYGSSAHWAIEPSAIEAWLAATVVQVVSIVLVITRYLFPGGGDRE